MGFASRQPLWGYIPGYLPWSQISARGDPSWNELQIFDLKQGDRILVPVHNGGQLKWALWTKGVCVSDGFAWIYSNATSPCNFVRFRFRRRLFDRFTWNTFANIITHTHIHRDIYREPIPSPKIEGRQPVSPAATGGNMSCHNDNSGCQQRQPSRQIDDPPSSMIMDE